MLETIVLSIIVLAIIGTISAGGIYLIRSHKTNVEETARVERLKHFYTEIAKKYPVKGDE